jgi:cyclopropane fatty-acyl-phospholipid synthase-like methyltransferase
MTEYWESRFKNEGAMWKFEPSDSALIALQHFKSEKINEILIPGFGYGRNAKLFIDNDFKVTGIEISRSAIELARSNNIKCIIHHGSVISMPFDNKQYGGIFCYALIHLLNKRERRTFLKSCFYQLENEGIMIFTVASNGNSLYGKGRKISRNRYEIAKGLKVYFYDEDSVLKEFEEFGMIECTDLEEPVKFMDGEEPVKLTLVICKKHEKHSILENRY